MRHSSERSADETLHTHAVLGRIHAVKVESGRLVFTKLLLSEL